MKCPKCNMENKDGAKLCKKCGTELNIPPVLWKPSWKWHVRALVIIYTCLIIAFFLMNHLLKPYLRQIPNDVTPWLKDLPKEESVG
ncbi:MAG: zinc ribbon domain-containing protein [Endomicrobiales bacterium]|nr:zinc ribbon domain-containing protein [Endomicrobiales bacterium]